MGAYVFECPHCNLMLYVQKKDVNCAIFRHGYNIKTKEQIPPHSSKEKCEEYLKDENIVGCCKPFKLVNGKPKICGYI